MDLLAAMELKEEQAQINDAFNNMLQPWWPDLSEYLGGLDNDPAWCQFDAVVLSIYKYFMAENERALDLSAVLKAVYFVKYIHGLVRDESEGQIHDRKLQFSILIGDFVFGYAFKMLLDSDSAMLIDSFSAMICDMNEGMVLEHMTDLSPTEKIQKTLAPLYEYAFLTGAVLAGCSADEKEWSKKLGESLGTAVELYIRDSKKEDIAPLVAESIRLFGCLNRSRPIPGSILEKIIAELNINCL